LVRYAVRNNIGQITEPMLDQRYPNNWKVGWTQSHGPALAKRVLNCRANASHKLIAQQKCQPNKLGWHFFDRTMFLAS